MSKNKVEFIPRENPPLFCTGFRIGSNGHVCIVDFIDTPDDNIRKVFTTVVLTQDTARDLVEKLNNFINED